MNQYVGDCENGLLFYSNTMYSIDTKLPMLYWSSLCKEMNLLIFVTHKTSQGYYSLLVDYISA